MEYWASEADAEAAEETSAAKRRGVITTVLAMRGGSAGAVEIVCMSGRTYYLTGVDAADEAWLLAQYTGGGNGVTAALSSARNDGNGNAMDQVLLDGRSGNNDENLSGDFGSWW